MVIENRAEVTWEGDLTKGSGRLRVGSAAFSEQTVAFGGRTEPAKGMTNPEELIAAAHAICYSMALSHRLSQNGTPPARLRVSAVSSLERSESGLKISGMDLSVEGDVPDLAPDEFRRLAEDAEKTCPVSNALRGNVEIHVSARPVSSAAR